MSALYSIVSTVIVLCLFIPQDAFGTGCKVDSDCQDYEFCVSDQCGDLRLLCRNPLYCGDHASCVTRNHTAICICKPGFSGNVDNSCIEEIDCHSQHECPGNLTCTSNTCKDLCTEMVCGPNAVCKTQNHFPTCECLAGYVRTDSSNITAGCQQCHVNTDCPSNRVCVSSRCEDLCIADMCGPNTFCKTQQHRVSCECQAGYVRTDEKDLTSGCRRLECNNESTCSADKYCKEGKCVATSKDSCDSCGPNTDCTSRDEIALCECKEDYAGFPYDKDMGCQWYVPEKDINSMESHFWINSGSYVSSTPGASVSIFLRTAEVGLEITSLQFKCFSKGVYNYTVSIEEVGKLEPIFRGIRVIGTTAETENINLPLLKKDMGVILHPNTQYRLTVSCNKPLTLYVHDSSVVLRNLIKFELPKIGRFFVSNVDSIGYKFLPRTAIHPKQTEQRVLLDGDFLRPITKGLSVSLLLKTRSLEVEIIEMRCGGSSPGEYKYFVDVKSGNDTDDIYHTHITHRVKTAIDKQYVYIPISRPNRRVILRANSQYEVTVSCDRAFYADIMKSQIVTTDHLTLELTKYGGEYLSPVSNFDYKIHTSS